MHPDVGGHGGAELLVDSPPDASTARPCPRSLTRHAGDERECRHGNPDGTFTDPIRPALTEATWALFDQHRVGAPCGGT